MTERQKLLEPMKLHTSPKNQPKVREKVKKDKDNQIGYAQSFNGNNDGIKSQRTSSIIGEIS